MAPLVARERGEVFHSRLESLVTRGTTITPCPLPTRPTVLQASTMEDIYREKMKQMKEEKELSLRQRKGKVEVEVKKVHEVQEVQKVQGIKATIVERIRARERHKKEVAEVDKEQVRNTVSIKCLFRLQGNR